MSPNVDRPDDLMSMEEIRESMRLEKIQESSKKETPTQKTREYSKLFVVPTKFLNTNSLSDLQVNDPGLVKYINCTRTTLNSGRNHRSRIRRLSINIVERFLCSLMRTQRCNGKKAKMYGAITKSFESIKKQTKKNPVQILINAIENSAPFLEQARLRSSGGYRAVEVSPSRRLSIAIRNLCLGIFRDGTKKSLPDRIAAELMLASSGSIQSFAVAKKVERENLAISVK
jgi:small subunit ribosomal protein S7